MARRRTIRSEAWENEVIWTRAQVLLDASGAALHPSDCHDWEVYVYDQDATGPSSGLALYSLTAQTPSDLVLSAYQTTGWEGDAPGYNVEGVLASDTFARAGGHTVRIEYQINTVNEGAISLVHFVSLVPLWHV